MLAPDELMLEAETRAFFGGATRSISVTAFYNGMRAGRYPRPIRLGGSARWLRTECEAAVRQAIERRDAEFPAQREQYQPSEI